MRKRIYISLFANLIKAVLNFLTAMFIAKSLGPNLHGEMSFLLGSFTSIKMILDPGTSSAFFTFISQKQREKKFVLFYFILLLIQFFIPLFLIYFLFPQKFIFSIWKTNDLNVIILAFLAVFFQSTLWNFFIQIFESQRKTSRLQLLTLGISIIHISAIIVLIKTSYLSINLIFCLIIIEYVIACLLALSYFKILDKFSDNNIKLLSFTNEFFIYCKPMLFLSILSFFYDFIDKWMLQSYSGNSHQSYFNIAMQFASIATVATNSFLNIFWKEIAESTNSMNLERIKLIYTKFTHYSYVGIAFFSCLLIPWTKDIVFLFLGTNFNNSVLTVGILFLFPLHQTIGQINNTTAYATNNIKLYTTINFFTMLFSIVITYFILAPKNAIIPGLHLESEGLAFKVLIIQFLSVNIFSYFICKKIGVIFSFSYQISTVIMFITIGFLSQYIITLFFKVCGNDLFFIKFFLSTIIYTSIILFITKIKPTLVGFSIFELKNILLKKD